MQSLIKCVEPPQFNRILLSIKIILLPTEQHLENRKRSIAFSSFVRDSFNGHLW